ncbi:metallophosphoesterase family protein [Fuerstiella marisgermanici]|uniref:Phosphoesterase n=1 Tax=Fuerstiella marisgermanici TaxID=1891926 RepID=A0A1P8WJ04_9PLAN|nr:YfcE family phosphodiesterase [Fuerstiella marisgermanici]APZ94040.1 phosphodiesterase [Fuerstiella marisgermanici]
MKILLIADIHSNWPALSAIDESFDQCIFLGDAVDYATEPAACIDWVQQNASYCVRGNHDHSVAQRVSVTLGGTFRQMASSMRPLHFEQLNDKHLTWLAQLPVTQHITIGDHSFLLVHATPRDPMDEYIANGREGERSSDQADAKTQWQARLAHVDVDFVCVGHTHIPVDLQLDGCRVINPGSVGQPRDGDPRASYAVIEDGEVEIRRVEYDIDRTVSHMRSSGVPDSVVRKADLILRSGGNPNPQSVSG